MAREHKAIRGGALIAANHVISAIVTIASALLLSRILGPRVFAVYTLCTSLSSVVRPLGRLGVNACLLTQSEEPRENDYHNALAVMLLSSILVASITGAALPIIERFSTVSDLFWPGIVTLALLPAHVISLPAITRLERSLHFKAVMTIELVSQAAGQCVGILLAYYGWGIWGPLLGWVIRAFILAAAPWGIIRLCPRVSWDGQNIARMIRYGYGYILATTLAQSRNFIILAVIGRVVGQEAVGLMGLTQRAIGIISPFRAAAARIVLPALSPISRRSAILQKGIESVAETELIFSVPITVLAVSLYIPCVPLLLGTAWQPTTVLLPWIAAGSLLTSAHAAALNSLHIRGFFKESAIATCIGDGALVLALFILGTGFGAEGCAAALIVVWPFSWLQEWFARKRLGVSWVPNAVAWAVGGAAACLAWRVGPWILILPVAISTGTYKAIIARFKTVAAAIRSRSQVRGETAL